MTRYSIGKMAKMNHISEQTLRLYDKNGLLKPIYVNEENGYRLYDIRQSFKLDTIQYLKHLGMSLKEIKELYEKHDLDLLQDKLELEQNHIQDKIRELQLQQKAVSRTLEAIDLYKNAPQPGSMTLEYIGKRHYVKVDEIVNIYDHDLETYETLLRDLKKELMAQGIHETYFFNPGSLMRQDYVEKRQFYSTELFVFVDEETPYRDIRLLPRHLYFCIYCDSFDHEIEYASKLFDEINKRGYRIDGDYICESINDLLLFDDNVRRMYLRLQVPVKIDKNNP